ncbi:lanthionine synthetase LanC family protein [Bacteroides oleiciplenus]|uniref:lanthionine synthetase LanC family protein n=1 Tax=Bacteroides oleiciplenus TaxID=626931 RepID=UPI0026DCA1D2|nr:lanthionine synthetase LanC family protein [Bacteroides oleiciplenus]
MKNESTIMRMELLDMIYERIISNPDSVNGKGLLEGKMGIILFLYKYSQVRESAKAKEEADIIVDELWTSLNLFDAPFSFFTGHPGIAWGLFELVQKGFLEIDNELNSYLESVDFSLFKEQKTKTPVIIDIESSMFTTGIYYLSRSLNVAGNYYWQENAIYLIEDCERILHKTTSYNNTFLPDLSPRLLNSILYFLIKVHRQKIYPSKTHLLIKHAHCQIVELIKLANIQDIIVSRYLLSELIKSFDIYDNIDLKVIKNSMQVISAKPEEIPEILSELGFYSLLYDNISIFEAGYNVYQDSQQFFNILITNHLNREELSLKVLLGIGFGLLTISEEYGKEKKN